MEENNNENVNNIEYYINTNPQIARIIYPLIQPLCKTHI